MPLDPRLARRNARIVALRAVGLTLEEIGRVVELSPERVRQVLREMARAERTP